MPDIRFECPSCGQHISAPEEFANQLFDCPGCKQTIEVPARSRPAELVSPISAVHQRPARRMPRGTVALVLVFCWYLLNCVLFFRQWREDQLTHIMSGTEESDIGWGLLVYIFWGFVGMTVGFLAGRARGKQRVGAAWGLALGPIGWLITLCTADRRLRCVECRGVIPEGARRCMHCGAAQVAEPSPAPVTGVSFAE